MIKRRPTTIEERVTPCHCCKFPLTHRHHALPFSDHGETLITHALCASCHEALHLMLAVHYKPTKRNVKVIEGLQRELGSENERLKKILALAWEHIDLLDDHKFTHLYVDFSSPLEEEVEYEVAQQAKNS